MRSGILPIVVRMHFLSPSFQNNKWFFIVVKVDKISNDEWLKLRGDDHIINGRLKAK